MAPRKKLGEILVQAGVLTESQLRAALTEQRRWGGPLGRILIDMKLIPEDTMVQALSHQLNLPSIVLDGRDIEPSVIDLIPGELAETHAAVPFAVQGKFLDVAMVDPTNNVAIDALRIKTRLNVRPYLAGPKAVERAISKHYGRGVAPLEVGGFGVRGESEPSIAIGGTPFDPGGGSAQGFAATPTQGFGPTPTQGFAAQASVTSKRAAQFGLAELAARETEVEKTIVGLRERVERLEAPIVGLQERVERLEALIARDEDVLRKLLTFLVAKGFATREELMDRIK